MKIPALTQTSNQLVYRPEIDGLRCFAVISVLLYHLEITLSGLKIMKGGFLGVDVFFVISGFLITSLLLREYDRNQTVSLLGFYERRFRRLMPVLIVVVLASFIPAWIYFLPNELISFSWSAVSSILFYSNFFWDITAQEYGAESALIKPLIHTWSLAIEEQYYLVFPVVFLLLVKRSKRALAWCICAGIIISFIAAVMIAKQDQSSAFFMLPTRLWELLIGALAAYLSIHSERVQNVRSEALVLAGVIMLVSSVLFIGFDQGHPGFKTLFPVFGTVLIILCAKPEQIITKILTARVGILIGLISYSLYLWHYPVFAFGRIMDSDPSALDKLVWVLISFFLATASYHLIEKTFRSRTRVSLKSLFIASIVSLSLLSTIIWLIIFNGGYESRIPPILQNLERDVSTPLVCNNSQLHCTAGKVTEGKDIFLLGDSHLRMLEKPILSLADRSGFKYNGLNSTACLFLPGLRYVQGSTGKVYFGCNEELQQRRENVLLKTEAPIVIMGGRFPYYLSGKGFDNHEGGIENQAEFFYQPEGELISGREKINKLFSDSFNIGVKKLLDNGATVILVYPIPEVGWHVPRVVNAKLAGKDFFQVESILENEPVTTSYNRYVERNDLAFKMLDSIQGKRIIRIFPHKLFCNTTHKDRCVTHSNSKIFYNDDDHLSDTGAEMLTKEIERALKEFNQ